MQTDMARWEGKRNEHRVGKMIQKVKTLAPKPDDFDPQDLHGGRQEWTAASCPHVHHGMLHPPNKINEIYLKKKEK